MALSFPRFRILPALIPLLGNQFLLYPAASQPLILRLGRRFTFVTRSYMMSTLGSYIHQTGLVFGSKKENTCSNWLKLRWGIRGSQDWKVQEEVCLSQAFNSRLRWCCLDSVSAVLPSAAHRAPSPLEPGLGCFPACPPPAPPTESEFRPWSLWPHVCNFIWKSQSSIPFHGASGGASRTWCSPWASLLMGVSSSHCYGSAGHFSKVLRWSIHSFPMESPWSMLEETQGLVNVTEVLAFEPEC